MRTYVDLTFSSGGTDPTVVAARLQRLAGIALLAGDHDLAFDWQTVEEFRQQIQAIHKALTGTGAIYRVRTPSEPPEFGGPVAWLPPASDEALDNPAYPRRKPGPPSERRIP